MSDETPAFDKVADHTFEKGEKIYVIDENGYDIYEAVLGEVTEKSWAVEYPEYPEDNFVAENTDRFLVVNEANTKIFKEQEEIRLQNEAAEAADEAGEEEEEEEEKMPKRRGKKNQGDEEDFKAEEE